MTDVPRLSVAGSDRERALLRAGAEEAPSVESVQAAARVLGIVPRAALVAYAIVAVAKSLKWSTFATYVLAPAAAVGGIAAAGYVVAVSAGAHGGDLAPVVHATAPVAPSVPPAVVSPPAPIVVPAPVVEAVPAAPVAPSKTASHRPLRAERRADVAAGLEEQVDWLDRARSLSASGDAAGALRALDDFDRRFGRSPMAEEAALLRLEATAARGDSSGAAALAQRFLAAHPHSVHAARVRSIVGAGAD
jgi:hypothetical protein